MTGRTARIAVAILGALTLVAPAHAQTLRGHLTDVATRTGVSGAAIILMADSQQVASGISDDAGSFTVTGPPGEYMVQVERIGYKTTTFGPVRLRTNGFAEINFMIAPQAIALDTVGVSVEPQDAWLRRSGFYDRRKEGAGTFVDYEQIQKKSSNRMAEVLGGLKGVRVINDPSNGGTDVQLRGSMTNLLGQRGQPPQACLPLVYVDGLLLADGKVAGPSRMNLEMIRPGDVAGIELYNGEASVPLQFARGGGQCGVLLFWTRSGAQRK